MPQDINTRIAAKHPYQAWELPYLRDAEVQDAAHQGGFLGEAHQLPRSHPGPPILDAQENGGVLSQSQPRRRLGCRRRQLLKAHRFVQRGVAVLQPLPEPLLLVPVSCNARGTR